MAKSTLATETILADSSNYTKGRNGYKICKFTPHHMAGILTGAQCARLFQNPNRNASANYCIGNDGSIVCNVDEDDRAWTSSSRSNDFQAITVEVSNCENGGEWRVSEAAWNSLVKLAVDVCSRYNFRLVYDGTPNGSLTRHNMFANTNCPGPYLQSRFQELADTVNAILDGNKPQPAPTPVPEPTGRKVGDVVKINGVYTASNSTKKLNPARDTGTITKIINGARNPYLLDNGNLGWVNDSVIVEGSASAPTMSKRMRVNTKAGLNVRSTPNGEKIGAIPYGTVVIVTEENNGWSKIGEGQWVASQYLAADESSSSNNSITFNKGDRVKLKVSAQTYATGERIPNGYKDKYYTIMQKGNGKSLLKELYSWVYDKDLTK